MSTEIKVLNIADILFKCDLYAFCVLVYVTGCSGKSGHQPFLNYKSLSFEKKDYNESDKKGNNI